MKSLTAYILFFIMSLSAYAQNLTDEIRNIVLNKKATIGVAVLYKSKVHTLCNDNKYPLMSVFKFHIAVTALKKMERENIALDSMVYIKPEQMHINTYSPLRDKYPNQKIHISYREIIEYTITVSDNNTCDWLIDFIGGIKIVDSYIKSIGVRELNLTETEDSMHEDIMRSYNNWSTPLAVVELLRKIYVEDILTKEHFVFLENAMLHCFSGKDKLIAGLPKNIKFAHKTGHSDRTDKGVQISDADAGIIYMPDGEKCYVAVIIKDSKESDETNAKIMSDISNVIYNCLMSD